MNGYLVATDGAGGLSMGSSMASRRDMVSYNQ